MTAGWQIDTETGKPVFITSSGDGVEIEELYDPRTPHRLRYAAQHALVSIIRLAWPRPAADESEIRWLFKRALEEQAFLATSGRITFGDGEPDAVCDAVLAALSADGVHLSESSPGDPMGARATS